MKNVGTILSALLVASCISINEMCLGCAVDERDATRLLTLVFLRHFHLPTIIFWLVISTSVNLLRNYKVPLLGFQLYRQWLK